MKKLVTVFCIFALSTMLSGSAFSADENKDTSSAQPQRPMMMDKNIAFISGSISKIDTTVPESVKVEVLNDNDGKSHVIDIDMNTNILKVVEAGELKAGDKARVVARKTGDKEIALSIVTGKLKEMQRPTAPIAPAQVVKKDEIKK